ncbi:hypothetical protein COOONC_21626 [Cooperia oncophora]
MAIVAGLSLPAVTRLKRTWSRVEKSKLEILQHQLDPTGNFLSYRATMKAAQWRAETVGSSQKVSLQKKKLRRNEKESSILDCNTVLCAAVEGFVPRLPWQCANASKWPFEFCGLILQISEANFASWNTKIGKEAALHVSQTCVSSSVPAGFTAIWRKRYSSL